MLRRKRGEQLLRSAIQRLGISFKKQEVILVLFGKGGDIFFDFRFLFSFFGRLHKHA